MHDEAVCSIRGPMRDIFYSELPLVRMAFLEAAELAAVIGRSDRHIGSVPIGEGERAEHIDDALHVDLRSSPCRVQERDMPAMKLSY
jgi:hypothetical protein